MNETDHSNLPALLARVRELDAGDFDDVTLWDVADVYRFVRENGPALLTLATAVESLQAREADLSDMIREAAPLAWAAANDMAGASEWEKRAVALLCGAPSANACLRAAVEEMRAENARLSKLADEWGQDASDYQGHISTLNVCVDQQHEELDTLRARVAQLSGALSDLLEALPQCQSCRDVGLREDCNIMLVCDDDSHGCIEDGGPKDVEWAVAARAARAALRASEEGGDNG